MKKIVSLMLVLVVLSTLVGCNLNIAQLNTETPSDTSVTPTKSTEKTEAEKAIIGTWKNDSNDIAIFNNDYTAIVKNVQGEIISEFRWKYDDELDLYVFVAPYANPQLTGVFIYNENGIDTFNFGSKFYRQTNAQ